MILYPKNRISDYQLSQISYCDNKHTIPVGKTKFYRRFNKRQRFTHLLIILSFLLLALTGMILKFAHMEWASWLANLLGGVKSAGNIHRFAAIITFGYFIFHLLTLIQLKAKSGDSLKEFWFGDNSLILSKQDWRDFIASMKWFFGKGPRPEYGRWTYWARRSTCWAANRESMRLVSKEVPNTGMAVSIDTGDTTALHPKNKKPVVYKKVSR